MSYYEEPTHKKRLSIPTIIMMTPVAAMFVLLVSGVVAIAAVAINPESAVHVVEDFGRLAIHLVILAFLTLPLLVIGAVIKGFAMLVWSLISKRAHVRSHFPEGN